MSTYNPDNWVVIKIGGGRSYIKSSMCPVHMHVVRDGEMVKEME